MESKFLLNIEEFNIKLDTKFIGRNFVYIDEIDSTNTFLLKTTEFTENGTVLFAEFQSEGKGRRNRQWKSEKGQNLTFSVLLTENINAETPNLYSFAASLAVVYALENLYQLKPEVKWPNDVLVNNKKIAGILTETTFQDSSITKMVIGIGINVNQPHFPGKFNFQPTSVKIEFGKIVKRERLLNEFLNIFEELLENIESSPENILNSWRRKCRMIGEKIKIVNDDGELFGILDDIDDKGFLILKSGETRRTIYSGDITVRKDYK